MGLLKLPSGERVLLLDEHVLGRSSSCDTTLEHHDTSSRHALFYWAEGHWWVRDLGSTNGTRLDGRRLSAGVPERLSANAQLVLGKSQVVLLDDGAPLPAAMCVETGELHTGEGSVIVIEQAADAAASIYLEHGAKWWLETGGSVESLVDGQVFRCGSLSYRFFAASGRVRTVPLSVQALRLANVQLEFRVSLDEEVVELKGSTGDQVIDFGCRAHNYTLLTLARRRQADAEDPNLPQTSHGWVDAHDLIRQLGSNETRLSVEVTRIRQQFSKAGFDDAADIVERRRGTRQLRIGTARFSVQRF